MSVVDASRRTGTAGVVVRLLLRYGPERGEDDMARRRLGDDEAATVDVVGVGGARMRFIAGWWIE